MPPVPQAGLPADAPWWQRWRAEVASWPGRAGSALAHELGGLITIQRVDEPAALLLSPEQADQVRGTLRQRLLTVQLAMLMRQPAVWKSELDNVGTTLAKYFDNRSPDTVAAQNLARELAQPIEAGGLGVSFEVARKWFARGGNPTVPLATVLELMRRLRAQA